jgi:hypothetical protein
MLNVLVVRYGLSCFIGLACSVAMAQPTPTVVVQPPLIAVDPARPVKPEPTNHLAVSVVITKSTVKIVSIKPGDGPPRGYLSDRPDLLVLVRSADGEILSRTNIPDPLQLRVWNTKTAVPRETTTTVASTKLTIYLPVLAGARTIEFRSGGEKGRVLGKGDIPR